MTATGLAPLDALIAEYAAFDPSTAEMLTQRIANLRRTGRYTHQHAQVFTDQVELLMVDPDLMGEPDTGRHVRVFHNIALHSLSDGYEAGDPLVEVDAWHQPAEDDHDHRHTLNAVFELLNVGDDPDYGPPKPQAVRYRLRGNRSLSVGDVVQVDGIWYASACIGWVFVPEPELLVSITSPCSTPHAVPQPHRRRLPRG